MRVLFTTLVFVCCTSAWAQTDSLKRFNQSANDTIQLLHRIDSLSYGLKSKYDSLSIVAGKPNEVINAYSNKLNALQQRLTHRIDSLKGSGKATLPLVKSLDSMRSKVDSLRGGIDKLKLSKDKIKEPEWLSSAQSKTQKMEVSVNEKLKLFNQHGNTGLPSGITTPGLNIPDLSVPNVDTNLPGLKEGVSLPSVDTPSLNEFGDLNKLKDLDLKTGELKDITGAASKYQGDLSKLNATELEKQAANISEIKELQSQTSDYNALMKKWSADPEVQKEMALTMAKDQAVNHFAGHENELNAAIQKMSKVKSKMKGADGVLDMMKKRQNPLQEKLFRERLVPGIGLQIQKYNENVWIDFNPYAGYRFYDQLTAGIGWNERISVNYKKWQTLGSEHIYGPRAYVEFKLKEFLWVKAESEWMNTFVLSALPAYQVETNSRMWIWTPMAGVKNVFTLSKQVKGHVQLLYNLYNPQKLSPYTSRLNVRFGFEFPLKKKVKKNTTQNSEAVPQ